MATTVQILQGTTARPRATFYSSGVPTDLDAGVPVVVGSRPDGTALAALSAAKVAATTGIYEVTNFPAQTAPTVIRLDWTGVIGGQAQTITTFVEVVGGFLFTLPDARAWDGAAITATIAADQAVLDKRVEIGDDFERICGVSFFPRFARETHSASGSDLVLHHQRATRLLSVTVAGAAQSVGGYRLDPSGILRTVSGYHPGAPISSGVANVTVEYVHGHDQVPGPITTAGLRVARAQLVPSNIGDRATSIATDTGTILLATAGRGQFQPYGIPLVDSVLSRYLEPVAA